MVVVVILSISGVEGSSGEVKLYHYGSAKLATKSTGVTVTGRLDPHSEIAHDLGTTSVRWRNVCADTLYGDGSNLTGVGGAGVLSVIYLMPQPIQTVQLLD